jgi:hypothetical protein
MTLSHQIIFLLKNSLKFQISIEIHILVLQTYLYLLDENESAVVSAVKKYNVLH